MIIVSVILAAFGISEILSGIFYPNIDWTLGIPDMIRGLLYIVAAFILHKLWKKKKAADAEKQHLKEQQEAEMKERIAKWSAEQDAARAARRAAEKEFRESHGAIYTKVVGVTFKNKDGSKRQRILKEIYEGDHIGGNVTLDEYNFDGEPAIAVNYDDMCVGNVPRKDVEAVRKVMFRIARIDLDVDEFENDEEQTMYRADLTVFYDE